MGIIARVGSSPTFGIHALREITKDMNERYDLIFNTTIKVLAIIVLIIAGVTLLNLNGIASNGRDVSNEAKDDGKLILKEVTESAVEALRERRERN